MQVHWTYYHSSSAHKQKHRVLAEKTMYHFLAPMPDTGQDTKPLSPFPCLKTGMDDNGAALGTFNESYRRGAEHWVWRSVSNYGTADAVMWAGGPATAVTRC